MTDVSLAFRVACRPERVRELLLDPDFLSAFVDAQHSAEKDVTVDRNEGVSVLSWTIRLDGDLPGVVTRFVGRTAGLRLVLDLGSSTLTMTATAKRAGEMTCDLRIDPDDDRNSSGGAGGSVLRIDGRLAVSGAFGGMVETTVRDQVIEPVFREDLVRLLEDWCVPATGQDARDVAEDIRADGELESTVGGSHSSGDVATQAWKA